LGEKGKEKKVIVNNIKLHHICAAVEVEDIKIVLKAVE
jgi:hypothetical protein